MPALILKIIAYVTMLIDHTAATLWNVRLIRSADFYMALRAVGRLAFPIFGFLLIEGVRHTKDKVRYGARILLLGVLSEIPFDLALFGGWYRPNYQNVFFTLALGLLVASFVDWCGKQEGKKAVGAALLTVAVAALAAWIAEKPLRCDYGWAGVLMIAVMSLDLLPWRALRAKWAGDLFLRLLIMGAGILVCVLLTNSIEAYAFFALLPIGLYNGKKGYQSRALQWTFYLIYPVHLLILGLVFILPGLR